MNYVAFLFHIYQPPLQSDQIVAKIVGQSYDPLTRLIREYGDLRFSLNINYSLVKLLHSPFPQVIDNIRCAYESGNLELTATGAYHPVFPLIPMSEVKKQIELNREGNVRLLSPKFSPDGIFPPELAFDGSLVSLFKREGYKWTIADDSNIVSYGTEVPHDKVYTFDGFAVFLRSNHWANRFANYRGEWTSGGDFVEELLDALDGWIGSKDGYLIIALDGETFGHHDPRLDETFLRELFDALRKAEGRIRTARLSDLYSNRRFRHVPAFIPPGSWSTDEPDARNRDYFSWWKSRHNRIHQLQWQFTRLVLDKVRRLPDPEINAEMDEALYSCQYWWASFWKFSPDEVYKGAFNMMRILHKAAHLLSGQDSEPLDALNHHLVEGEDIFRRLVTEIEKKHHRAED